MLPTTVLFLISVPLIAFLGWMLWRRLASDRLQLFNDQRRGSSQLVSRGEFVDGSRHLPVALALTDGEFFYENADMQASLERQWIHEIEYDDELATGGAVGDATVLRLRCFSQTFEFVLPSGSVPQWKSLLPPHRMSAAASA